MTLRFDFLPKSTSRVLKRASAKSRNMELVLFYWYNRLLKLRKTAIIIITTIIIIIIIIVVVVVVVVVIIVFVHIFLIILRVTFFFHMTCTFFHWGCIWYGHPDVYPSHVGGVSGVSPTATDSVSLWHSCHGNTIYWSCIRRS